MRKDGRLALKVVASQPGDRMEDLESFIHQKQQFAILSGCWLNQLTPSILQCNDVAGILLDRTFTMTHACGAAILMAVMANVGIT